MLKCAFYISYLLIVKNQALNWLFMNFVITNIRVWKCSLSVLGSIQSVYKSISPQTTNNIFVNSPFLILHIRHCSCYVFFVYIVSVFRKIIKTENINWLSQRRGAFLKWLTLPLCFSRPRRRRPCLIAQWLLRAWRHQATWGKGCPPWLMSAAERPAVRQASICQLSPSLPLT